MFIIGPELFILGLVIKSGKLHVLLSHTQNNFTSKTKSFRSYSDSKTKRLFEGHLHDDDETVGVKLIGPLTYHVLHPSNPMGIGFVVDLLD